MTVVADLIAEAKSEFPNTVLTDQELERLAVRIAKTSEPYQPHYPMREIESDFFKVDDGIYLRGNPTGGACDPDAALRAYEGRTDG